MPEAEAFFSFIWMRGRETPARGTGSDNFVFQPLAGEEAAREDEGAEAPVGHLSNPDSDGAEAEDADQDCGKRYTAAPHSNRSNGHGEADISGSTESVAGNEGQGPADGFDDGNPVHHEVDHGNALCFHTSDPDNRAGQKANDDTGGYDNQFRIPGQLQDIVLGFFPATCTHGLSYDRHEPDADSDTRYSIQVLKDDGHSLGGDGGCSECGDGRLDGELTKLEHSVLDARGDSDREHTDNQFPVRANGKVVSKYDWLAIFSKTDQHKTCDEDTSHQSGQSRACNSHVKTKDQKCIACNIQHISRDGYDHWEAAVTACAEEGRARLEHCQKGEGCCRNQEVDLRVRHNRCIDLTENQAKNRLTEKNAYHSKKGRDCNSGQENLLGSLCRFLPIFSS